VADIGDVLIGIARGDFDTNLGHIADALEIRNRDLIDQQIAAVAIAAYIDKTGLALEDVVAGKE
jgi:hypothetical protein